jgi:hypothetical protein
MTSYTAELQIKNALNKLDSQDYVNVESWKIQEAVNIATLRFARRHLPNKERDNINTEDISILLKDKNISGANKEYFFLSQPLPEDYFGLSRVAAKCVKNSCPARIASDWVEDANADEFLQDWATSPSFDFGQVFHTLSGKRIKVYHGGDFQITELDISYYRKPQYIQFEGAPLEDKGIGKDMVWEWKSDVADYIIEWAVWILSGNTGDYNRQQISTQIIQS